MSGSQGFRTIKSPRKLSLKTAVRLFDIKVSPVATYGLRLIWKYLNTSDLLNLEKVKSSYLKRVLGVHTTSSNRLVYQLAREPPFVKTLKERLQLVQTIAFEQFMVTWDAKEKDTDPLFYTTPAMTNEKWKNAACEERHRWTRAAIHGFHHRLCLTSGFHIACDTCVCRFCGEPCEMYHIMFCLARPVFWRLAVE